MKRILLALTLGLFFVSSLSPAPVYAASKAEKKAAKKSFKKGKKLYKKKKYKKALGHFMQANSKDPNKGLVKIIVKTYDKLDNPSGAASYLQTVIDAGHPEDALDWAKDKIKDYKEVLEKAQEEEVEKAKTEARLKAEKEAEEKRKKEEAAREAEEAEKAKKRRAEEKEKQKEIEKARADAQARAKKNSLVAYAAAGIAVAGVGGGVNYGLKAIDARDKANECAKNAVSNGGTCEEATHQGHQNDSKDAALLADISWGVGIAGGTTAAIFYLMAQSEIDAAPAPYEAPKDLAASETESKEEDTKEEAAPEEPAPEKKETEGSPDASLMFFPGGLGVVGTF